MSARYRLLVEVWYPDEPGRNNVLLVHESLRSQEDLRISLVQLERLLRDVPDIAETESAPRTEK